jgi:hypothetical protein
VTGCVHYQPVFSFITALIPVKRGGDRKKEIPAIGLEKMT